MSAPSNPLFTLSALPLQTFDLQNKDSEKLWQNLLSQILNQVQYALTKLNDTAYLSSLLSGVFSAAQGFISKTGAYTLTSADSGKYIIGSGGSWTLTLPAPAVGLWYRVRNDMGIVAGSTTGTITISPTGGTIDGQASIALLPQQECVIISDGTNWRTHELKREVILGTLDIASATASGTVLLPAGYRYFDLYFASTLCSVDAQTLQMQLSSDGGSTFNATNYYYGGVYNNSTTTAAGLGANIATFAHIGVIGTTLGASIRLRIYPGSLTQRASWLAQNEMYNATFIQTLTSGGWLAPTTLALMNAVKFTPASGTINNMFLTVKGVV